MSRQEDKACIGVILCPKSVIDVWPREFEKHCAVHWDLLPLNKGTVKAKSQQLAKRMALWMASGERGIVILNYEAAWRDPLCKVLLSITWDFAIFDEIHRIKSASGKASMFCSRLRDKAVYRRGLTGTIMPHSPVDVYAQFRAVDAGVFGTVAARFKQRYCVMGGFQGHQIVGYQHEPELHDKVESISYIVGREVLDLPKATFNERFFELESKTARIYDAIESDFYAWLGSGEEVTVANALTKLLRLQQICGGFLTDDKGNTQQVSRAKLDTLEDILADIPLDEPVIIFCLFRAEIQAIKELCTKMDRPCAELSGSANQLKEWQDNETFNAIVVQIKSGGVGIDLTRSHYCIYYSLGFSLGDYEQSLARCDRPGQLHPVRYYSLLAKDTVDEKVYGALYQKKKVVEHIMNGGRR